jgi:hypothetical protein
VNKQYTANGSRHYLNTIGDALDDIRHELVGLRDALPCKEGCIVVVAAELTDHEQRLGKELLAFYTMESINRTKIQSEFPNSSHQASPPVQLKAAKGEIFRFPYPGWCCRRRA